MFKSKIPHEMLIRVSTTYNYLQVRVSAKHYFQEFKVIFLLDKIIQSAFLTMPSIIIPFLSHFKSAVFPYLNSSLRQTGFGCKPLSCADAGVMTLIEFLLQFIQLTRAECSSIASKFRLLWATATADTVVIFAIGVWNIKYVMIVEAMTNFSKTVL